MEVIAIAVVVVGGLIGERIWHYNLSRPLAEVEDDKSGGLWALMLLLIVAFVFAMGFVGLGAM